MYAWYTRVRYRKRQRPMTDEEHERYQECLLQERLEEMGLIPLQTVDNSLRRRLGLVRSAAPTQDPISNRRPRHHNLHASITAPLLLYSLDTKSGTCTPQRPRSARTVASSIGRRSASSPLSPHHQLAPPLPVVTSTPRNSVLIRSPQAVRFPVPQRSISSPAALPHAAMIPENTHLPPVISLVGSSALVQSLRIYKEDLVERECMVENEVSLSSFLKATGLCGNE